MKHVSRHEGKRLMISREGYILVFILIIKGNKENIIKIIQQLLLSTYLLRSEKSGYFLCALYFKALLSQALTFSPLAF